MSFMIVALVLGKLRVPSTFPCMNGLGVELTEALGAGEPCVLVRLRLGAVREVSSAISRPRMVSRRRRVERRVSSTVVERREGVSEAAGVAGSGLMASLREARDWERVRVLDVVLSLRGWDFVPVRLEDLERVFVLVVCSWVEDLSGGKEGARSLIGLISSGPGRFGEPIVRTEPGSRPFHLVAEAGVTIGEGRGGRGLPDAVV